MTIPETKKQNRVAAGSMPTETKLKIRYQSAKEPFAVGPCGTASIRKTKYTATRMDIPPVIGEFGQRLRFGGKMDQVSMANKSAAT